MSKSKTGMKAFISLDGNGRVIIEMYPQPQEGSFAGPCYNLQPAFPLTDPLAEDCVNIVSSETRSCIAKGRSLGSAIKLVFERCQ